MALFFLLIEKYQPRESQMAGILHRYCRAYFWLWCGLYLLLYVAIGSPIYSRMNDKTFMTLCRLKNLYNLPFHCFTTRILVSIPKKPQQP